MRFRRALHSLLDYILSVYHRLGPTFLRKVDLDDVYMCIWVWLNNMPFVDILVPKETNR